MTTAAILYDTAMEYYDFGKIALAKREVDVYENYLQRVYMISREAALRGQIDEARQFTNLGLSSLPPQSERIQLEELLTKIETTHSPTSTTVGNNEEGDYFLGTLVSVDLEYSLAKVKDINSREYYPFKVPIEQIEQVARLYIGNLVKVFTTSSDQQPLPFRGIQLAA